MKKTGIKKAAAFATSLVMALTLAPQTGVFAAGTNAGTQTPANPSIVSDSSMTSGQKTTWDCIWFGSYPQTEIVNKAETSGAYGKEWEEDGDYVVDSSLYSQLETATYDSNGDTTINGTKYRRIAASDTTYYTSGHGNHYAWSESMTYHYFRYEPVKWRVLETNGTEALVVADKALDDREYNTTLTSVTWETCTIRSWLNGYGSSENIEETDYTSGNFIDAAFSQNEQNAIINGTVVNNDNNYSGTEGGNDTTDKIFLLAESDVYTKYGSTTYGGKAEEYGFAAEMSCYDEARRCKSTTYAKAMGTFSSTYNEEDGDYTGNCWWWLRSPGDYANYAAHVDGNGFADGNGHDVDCNDDAVRPALRLNLSSSDLWTYAGTVCSDGTEEEQGNTHVHDLTLTKAKAATCTEDGNIECWFCAGCGKHFSDAAGTKTVSRNVWVIKAKGHTYSAWKTTKAATVFKAGTKTRTCTVCKTKQTKTIKKLTPTIKLSATKKTLKVNKTYTLKVSKLANGDSVKSFKSSNAKVAAVTSKGKITAKKNGTAVITVTLKSGKTAKCKVTVK